MKRIRAWVESLPPPERMDELKYAFGEEPRRPLSLMGPPCKLSSLRKLHLKRGKVLKWLASLPRPSEMDPLPDAGDMEVIELECAVDASTEPLDPISTIGLRQSIQAGLKARRHRGHKCGTGWKSGQKGQESKDCY